MNGNDTTVGKAEDTYSAFVVFAFLFAWAQFFEHRGTIINFFGFLIISPIASLRIIYFDYFSMTVWVLAALVIIKPSSLYTSIPLFVFVIADTITALPKSPNHVVFEVVVLTTILICFVYLKLKEKSNFTQKKFYEAFAPAVRLEVIVLYFWAALHKINTGFFDRDISCATIQIFNIKDAMPIFPTPNWLISINPYLTVLTEGSIPVLLIIPKTRIVGLTIALVFHFILGFRYANFTIFVYSLLSLFVPPTSYDRLKPKFNDLKHSLSTELLEFSNFKNWKKTPFDKFINHFIFMIAIFLLMAFLLVGIPRRFVTLSRHGAYLAFCFILFIAFFYFIVMRVKESKLEHRLTLIPEMKWLLIFPALVLFLGLLPHLGIKNIQAMAMFSNLRTEGGTTNHILIPSSLQVFNNLEDLVKIKGANVRVLNRFSGYASNRPLRGTKVTLPKSYIEYMEENKRDYRTSFQYQLPFVLLQNLVTELSKHGVEDIELEYEKDGEIVYTSNAENDPILSNASIVQIKLLDQRAVPDDERGLCMW